MAYALFINNLCLSRRGTVGEMIFKPWVKQIEQLERYEADEPHIQLARLLNQTARRFFNDFFPSFWLP